MYLPWVPSKNSIALNRCRALKKAIVSAETLEERLFPLPIFPHPSPCRHSHFPIWWTIKRLLQQFFLSKLHSTLPRFLFENSIKEKKIASSSLEFCFEKKKRFVPAPQKNVFDSGGFFITNFQEEIVEWKWL